MKFTTVIFDLDGTLLDSYRDIGTAVNLALHIHGFPEHKLEEYLGFIGNGVYTLLSRALPEQARTDSVIARINETFTTHYETRWAFTSKLFDDIPETLDQLTVLGIRLALLSNKQTWATKLCAERFLAKWPFEAVVGAGGKIRHKPDPSGVNHILETLAVSPDEVATA